MMAMTATAKECKTVMVTGTAAIVGAMATAMEDRKAM